MDVATQSCARSAPTPALLLTRTCSRIVGRMQARALKQRRVRPLPRSRVGLFSDLLQIGTPIRHTQPLALEGRINVGG